MDNTKKWSNTWRKRRTKNTCKINVNTENQQAFAAIVRNICATTDAEKVYDPRKILGPAKQGIRDVVKAKCEVFGCIGKAE